MAAAAILEKFQMAISPQRLMIYLYSAHRAVIFAIAQLSCYYRGASSQLPIIGRGERPFQTLPFGVSIATPPTVETAKQFIATKNILQI